MKIPNPKSQIPKNPKTQILNFENRPKSFPWGPLGWLTQSDRVQAQSKTFRNFRQFYDAPQDFRLRLSPVAFARVALGRASNRISMP